MVTSAFARDFGHRPASTGLPLASLAASSLDRHYYSWLGISGTRYVCTVFKAGQEAVIRAFTAACIIGVTQRGGVRQPVCVLDPCDFDDLNGQVEAKVAIALGVNEWHVHFSADRRKLSADLGSC